MEGSGWFYPPALIWPSFDKSDLVVLWRTLTPSQFGKFGWNSNLPPSPPPTPRVVMWLKLGQSALVFSPPQLWLCQGWSHGKARLVRLYSQTVTAFWEGKSSCHCLYQLRGATRGHQLGEPNCKYRQCRAKSQGRLIKNSTGNRKTQWKTESCGTWRKSLGNEDRKYYAVVIQTLRAQEWSVAPGSATF